MRKNILFLLLLFVLTGCSFQNDQTYNAKNRIRDYCEIIIPEECEMIFYHSYQSFGPGRPGLYAVFSFDVKPEKFLEENDFIDNKNQEFEKEFQSSVSNYVESYNVNVPTEYLANFYQDYYYFESQGVYIIYFSFNNMLISYAVPH